MTEQETIQAAQQVAQQNKIPMVVVKETYPEWPETPYNFCPQAAISTLYLNEDWYTIVARINSKGEIV